VIRGSPSIGKTRVPTVESGEFQRMNSMGEPGRRRMALKKVQVYTGYGLSCISDLNDTPLRRPFRLRREEVARGPPRGGSHGVMLCEPLF
jgi:hypothetical protein